MLAVKIKTVNTEVGVTSFTCQIKHPKNIIFSLQKMENLLKQIVNNTEARDRFQL